MLKKLTAFCLILCLVVSLFSGCGKKTTINGTVIDKEVVSYFESTLGENESLEKKLSRYVAINSEFNNLGLEVKGTDRATLAENVNDLWHIYGEYYKSKGISKETIYKIELSKVYETILLENYYGEKGKSPVSEKEIKAYFRENFASIRFVTGYLFELSEDEAKPLSEKAQKALVKDFNAVADTINSGTDITEAIEMLDSADVHNAVVGTNNGGNFPDGFWDKVKGLETGKASAFTLGSYVFVVQRVDAEDGEFECYNDYRSLCLYEMKGEEFGKVIDEWAKQYNS